MALLPEQINQLLAPLDPSRVQHDNKGMSHLAAWDVRRWLIRIFGPTGWRIETISCELIFENETKTKMGREAWYVGYRAQSRLTVCGTGKYTDSPFESLAFFEDGAIGDATLPTRGDAHDMAMKTALSQALKRCAMNLGDQFGLSLYNNGSAKAVVGKSLAHPDGDEVAAGEAVEGDTENISEVEPEVPAVREPKPAVRGVKPASKKSSLPTMDDIERIAALCERLDAAETLGDLDIVAKDIVSMNPKPSDGDLKILQDTWKERKVALSA